MQTTLNQNRPRTNFFADFIRLYLLRSVILHGIYMVDALYNQDSFNEIQADFSEGLNESLMDLNRWINELRSDMTFAGHPWWVLEETARKQAEARFKRPETLVSCSVGSEHWICWSGSTGASTSAGFYFDKK